MKLNCKVCDKIFIRYGKQIKTAKTCSVKCSSELRKGELNTTCSECGIDYHLKNSSKKRYKRTHGYFCSTKCVANFRKKEYLGENNPNFRENVTTDGGYKLAYLPKFGRIKLHHKVVFETININKLPEGYVVHHRDCNINNNSPDNLVLITPSDHRWLHKQFGNATLWAYCNGKVTLDELMIWSNNKEKSERLLPLNILKQIMNFKELNIKVIDWAKDKNIFEKATSITQHTKTLEEVDELTMALKAQEKGNVKFTCPKGNLKNTEHEIKDAIGDILVTLIIQSEMQGLTIEDCLESAYNVISKRTGKMVNGIFVKDKD